MSRRWEVNVEDGSEGHIWNHKEEGSDRVVMSATGKRMGAGQWIPSICHLELVALNSPSRRSTG
jgi:hypothetical protein